MTHSVSLFCFVLLPGTRSLQRTQTLRGKKPKAPSPSFPTTRPRKGRELFEEKKTTFTSVTDAAVRFFFFFPLFFPVSSACQFFICSCDLSLSLFRIAWYSIPRKSGRSHNERRGRRDKNPLCAASFTPLAQPHLCQFPPFFPS